MGSVLRPLSVGRYGPRSRSVKAFDAVVPQLSSWMNILCTSGDIVVLYMQLKILVFPGELNSKHG